MYTKALFLSLFATSFAFAHGPKSEQASNAIKVATQSFQKSVAQEVSKRFQSVTAIRTGHEQFAITITTTEPVVKLAYDCSENEMVDPVVWECKAMTADAEE